MEILDISDPTLGNSLFGAVKSVKNADIDKYKYSGYGIGFLSFHDNGANIYLLIINLKQKTPKLMQFHYV